MKKIIKREIWILIFLLAFVSVGIYSLFENRKENYLTHEPKCPIEYGRVECLNGTLVIPFFNPNNYSIEQIQIIVPTLAGKDIYNVVEPLEPQKVKVLTLFQCTGNVNMENFKIRWCCASECYESKMNRPTKDLKIES